MVGALIAVGVIGAVVVADGHWAWRDTLRRMAHGEEVPAFRANAWSDAHAVRESLADDLLKVTLSPSMEDRATRRSLALHTLITSAGEETITRGEAEMGALMEELSLDVDWLEEMVYFCPMEHAGAALPILAHIYRSERKRMEGMPCNRRLASAMAFEFARAGLDKDAARKAYLFYAAGGQKHWLNNCFANLALWEMRAIAARCTDAEWNSEETLTWFQRNNRLPAQGYVTLGDSLGSRECSLFGVSVDTPAFLALYRDAAGTASMYESSGCSTARNRAFYAATAACANGVPALVVSGSDGEATCLVDVNGRWVSASRVEAATTASWGFLGMNHPDFVELAAILGSDKDKAYASARLAQMGQFLYDAGNRPLSHDFYREAVKVQPLNYVAWVGYHASGAPREELNQALEHFAQLPGVAAALRSLLAE